MNNHCPAQRIRLHSLFSKNGVKRQDDAFNEHRAAAHDQTLLHSPLLHEAVKAIAIKA